MTDEEIEEINQMIAYYRDYTDNPYIMVVSKDFNAIANAMAALRLKRDQYYDTLLHIDCMKYADADELREIARRSLETRDEPE